MPANNVWRCTPSLSGCLFLLKVWCDHCREPQGPLQAASLEQPAEQLQGAESPCGGTPQQPQGEPHAVQQAPQTG